jgi:hypothetical protein
VVSCAMSDRGSCKLDDKHGFSRIKDRANLFPLCSCKSSARRRFDYFRDFEKRRFLFWISLPAVRILVLALGVQNLRHFLGHACANARSRIMPHCWQRSRPACCCVEAPSVCTKEQPLVWATLHRTALFTYPSMHKEVTQCFRLNIHQSSPGPQWGKCLRRILPNRISLWRPHTRMELACHWLLA